MKVCEKCKKRKPLATDVQAVYHRYQNKKTWFFCETCRNEHKERKFGSAQGIGETLNA